MDTLAQLKSALADRYAIEREIGAGGMATVYLARDIKHDRQVALKVLRADVARTLGAERFLREIQFAAKLTHPNILSLFDSGDVEGTLFYAMPNVEGLSLRDRLDQTRQLPVDDAVRIASEVAGALDYAHRHGVVHRDIKPENIMLHDGHAMVADFGIGKALSAVEGEAFTNTGMSVGTPAYMSPEQAAGEAVDGRSDIYSLGCVLYEMLVGEQPFTGNTIQAVIAKRFVQTPADVTALREGVSRAVAHAVQKALARTPIDRYDTAAVFVTSLAEIESIAVPARHAAPEKSIAVLPFDSMSADPEDVFFADGITEEILNALAPIPDLRVAGRASSFSFKGKQQNLRAIGEQLNVRTVLEGSVRRSGKRVRITAQLSDVTDGYRLWSERYDREIEDVFAVQDEIASAIAAKLKTTLQGDTATRAQRATDNIEAYEAYLKGRTLIYRRGAAVKEGVALMRRALQLDPDYAPAWAGLADAHSVFAYFGMAPADVCSSTAREAAAKALALGPDLAESHNAIAQVSLLFDWDWARAEVSFKRAIEFNPNYVQASAWYGLFYLGFLSGRREEAIAHLRALRDAEPLSGYATTCLGYLLSESGYSSEALRVSATALELDPTSYLCHWARQMVFHAAGRYAEAIEVGDRALAMSGRQQSSVCVQGVSLAASGDLPAARAALAELDARSAREPIFHLYRAFVAASIGEPERAIGYARESLACREPPLVVFGRCVAAKALLALPEYQEILGMAKFPGQYVSAVA